MAPPRTEGERWAREELRRLRAARYASHAGTRFIAASAHRASEARTARPSLARQANAWLCAGGLGWVALAVAGRQPYRRRIISGLAWWATVGAMLRWHLGMVETEDGDPRPLSPADALTLARAWLVPAIADDLDPRRLAVAALTDVLDGTVARAGHPTRVYFARAEAPDPRVTRAARRTTPVRVAGLLAAGAGRRRSAHVLLIGGSIGSVTALARRAR